MELEIFINSQDQSTNSLKNMIDYSNKMLNNKLKIKIYDMRHRQSFDRLSTHKRD